MNSMQNPVSESDNRRVTGIRLNRPDTTQVSTRRRRLTVVCPFPEPLPSCSISSLNTSPGASHGEEIAPPIAASHSPRGQNLLRNLRNAGVRTSVPEPVSAGRSADCQTPGLPSLCSPSPEETSFPRGVNEFTSCGPSPAAPSLSDLAETTAGRKFAKHAREHQASSPGSFGPVMLVLGGRAS
jgi:hypothetical protein